MMAVLYWSLGIIVALLVFRYVPGFKCVSYCRFKQFRHRRAVNKLRTMSEIYECQNTYDDRVRRVECKDVSTKVLIKLYDNTTPFGCTSFNRESWLDEAREHLKNSIAERVLLEDK